MRGGEQKLAWKGLAQAVDRSVAPSMRQEIITKPKQLAFLCVSFFFFSNVKEGEHLSP